MITSSQACETCGGTGLYIAHCPTLPDIHNTVLTCSCEAGLALKQQRVATLRALSDLPLRLTTYTFDSYRQLALSQEQARAALVCEAYSQQGKLILKSGIEKYGMFLTGNVGTGKSGLAAAVANVAMQAGIPVLYRTVPDLLDYIRSTFNPASTEQYGDVFDRVKRADLLVLDDLGTESPTAWVTEKLYQIVDFRYRHTMRLIVTSNYTLPELIEHFERAGDAMGRRIVDRIMEMCAVVNVSGNNLRG